MKIPEIHYAIDNTQHRLKSTIDAMLLVTDEDKLDEKFKSAKIQLCALYSLKSDALKVMQR